MSETTNDCPGCKREGEPGWIETDNNGPIVPCWLCNRERWLDDRDGRTPRHDPPMTMGRKRAMPRPLTGVATLHFPELYSSGFLLDITITAHTPDGTPIRIGEKTYPVGPDGKIVEADSNG